jgi:hypothetical protein
MSTALIASTPSGGSSELTAQDRAVLDRVEGFLSAGVQLKQWWERTHATGAYTQRFEEALTFNRPDISFGFFGQAPVNGQLMPVMGNLQDMLYDKPKSPTRSVQEAARWMRDQIREFVLHYFMRVSDFRQPQAAIENRHSPPPFFLRPFSACPQDEAQRIGFGFSQLYYKRRDTGEVGKFPEAERYAIVDLRDIGPKFEWIVLNVRIFDFSFTYAPLGLNAPQVVFPLTEASYLVMSRDFVTHEEDPEPDVLGRYGFGYAFIKNPDPSLLAYGPGEFDAAIEMITFRVLGDGTTRVNMVFVANRPNRILNVTLDPIQWSFTLADLASFGMTSRFLAPMKGMLGQLPMPDSSVDPVYASIALLNLLTGGLSSTELCISIEELEKQFLLKHFMQHYQTLVGSLQTWRQIPNWTVGEAKLLEDPRTRWVVTGRSS